MPGAADCDEAGLDTARPVDRAAVVEVEEVQLAGVDGKGCRRPSRAPQHAMASAHKATFTGAA